MSRTHYETLEVSQSATPAEVKSAFRRLARKYHPDRNKAKGAEARFKEINLAYQTIGDPQLRMQYDAMLNSSAHGTASTGSSSSTKTKSGAQPQPPPSPPNASSARSGAKAAAPPPAQQPYRYLFFSRGVLVGGGGATVLFALALLLYVACRRRQPTAPSIAPPSAQPVPAAAAPTPPPAITPTREPEPTVPSPDPTLTEISPLAPLAPKAMPEPTTAPNPIPEPTPAPAPVQVSGQWLGDFEWQGRRVLFRMQLKQDGSKISGVWTESRDHGVFRAAIHGEIHSLTLTIVLRYDLTPRLVRNRRTATTARFIASRVSPVLLGGTWEAADGNGSWQAVWEGQPAGSPDEQPRHDSWRLRSRRTSR